MGATRNTLVESRPEPPPAVLPDALQMPLPIPVLARSRLEKTVAAVPPKPSPRSLSTSVAGRCMEKGCVFPALPGTDGRCLHHQRQQREPSLYCSHQPSFALVERSKFGEPRGDDLEPASNARTFERRRLVAERERFLGEQQ